MNKSALYLVSLIIVSNATTNVSLVTELNSTPTATPRICKISAFECWSAKTGMATTGVAVIIASYTAPWPQWLMKAMTFRCSVSKEKNEKKKYYIMLIDRRAISKVGGASPSSDHSLLKGIPTQNITLWKPTEYHYILWQIFDRFLKFPQYSLRYRRECG